METIEEDLEESGVHKENIIYLNPDTRGFHRVKTADQLDALREEEKYSVFITGSNS